MKNSDASFRMKRILVMLLLPFALAFVIIGALATGNFYTLNAAPPPDNATPIICVNGSAGPYPCHRIDLISHLTIADMGGGSETKGNDLWGWTDPLYGSEYVLVGLTDGTAFVNISDPEYPQYLGTLPTHTISSTWRDIKVYNNHAYIVADRPSLHGMQVFDLAQLRSVKSPTTFTETAHYDQFGNGHNLFINEDTGYAYVFRSETCSGAFHMIDLQDPLNPAFAGCFEDDGLTSDTQCVVYSGPDSDYQGREICFTGSDDAFTIGDVTDKNAPVQISRLTYSSISRAHQGSLTEDQRYFLLSDTLDEVNLGNNTRTYLWDAADLEDVIYMGFYEHTTSSVDHNIYVMGDFAYQANFRAGLRIMDIQEIGSGILEEAAFFDVDPDSDSPIKTGAWSSYPWFESGLIAVSDTEQGLFLLRANLDQDPTDVALTSVFVSANGSGWQLVMWVTVAIAFAAIFLWRIRSKQHA